MTKEGEPVELPSEITENGKKVLGMIAECRKNAKYQYPGNVYEWLGDPTIPDLGDLNDLDTPCNLTINDYYTPDFTMDDYNETRKDVLLFDKKMIIEALSKIQPNQMVVVTGKGRAIHHYERGGFEYRTESDKMISNIDNEVDITLTIELIGTLYPHSVKFNFDSKPVSSTENFVIRRSVFIVGNGSGSISQDILV